MTRTFERFLRSMSDEELERFACERASVRPPYWRMLHVAVRIEAGRRGLDLGRTFKVVPGATDAASETPAGR